MRWCIKCGEKDLFEHNYCSRCRLLWYEVSGEWWYDNDNRERMKSVPCGCLMVFEWREI